MFFDKSLCEMVKCFVVGCSSGYKSAKENGAKVPRCLNHTKKKGNSFYGVKNWKEVTETFREKIMCVTYILKKNSSSRTLKIVVLH